MTHEHLGRKAGDFSPMNLWRVPWKIIGEIFRGNVFKRVSGGAPERFSRRIYGRIYAGISEGFPKGTLGESSLENFRETFVESLREIPEWILGEIHKGLRSPYGTFWTAFRNILQGILKRKLEQIL